MRNQSTTTLWMKRALFVSLALFTIIIAKVPLGLPADASLTPDLFFALCVAWVIRAPSAATLPLIFGAALCADLIMMRPVGLGALLTVLATEYFRAQRFTLREQMFVIEWLFFLCIFAISLGLQASILAITFAEVPPIDRSLNYILWTALSYPLVVGVVRWVFRISSPQNELETSIGGG